MKLTALAAVVIVVAVAATACGGDGQEPIPAPGVKPSEDLATPGSPEPSR